MIKRSLKNIARYKIVLNQFFNIYILYYILYTAMRIYLRDFEKKNPRVKMRWAYLIQAWGKGNLDRVRW